MNDIVGQFNLSQILSQILTDLVQEQDKKIIDIVSQVGISQPTWSRIQAGSSYLSIDEINKICQLCGLDTINILKQVIETANQIESKDLARLTYIQTESIINRTTLKYLIALTQKN